MKILDSALSKIKLNDNESRKIKSSTLSLGII